MSRSVRIIHNINQDIKVGDKVTIRDYSYLTNVVDNKEVYGLHNNTGVIKVVEVGVNDFVAVSDATTHMYLQDVVVQIGDKKYRTLSGFLIRKRTPVEIIQDRLEDEKESKFTKMRSSYTLAEIAEIDKRIKLLEGILNDINNFK